MKKILAALALFSLTALPAFATGQHDTAPAPDEKAAATAGNPLLEEMFTLDSAFKEIVSGVALGDGARVHGAIESLHGKRERTTEALHSGKIKPPKNPDKIKEFEKLDGEFHSELEALASAAGKNDQKMMLSAAKKLLDGCVNCHRTFRK